MRNVSRRDKVLLGAVVGGTAAVMTVVGPRYLTPLPLWWKLAIAAFCAAFIAAAAVYSRRRARGA